MISICSLGSQSAANVRCRWRGRAPSIALHCMHHAWGLISCLRFRVHQILTSDLTSSLLNIFDLFLCRPTSSSMRFFSRKHKYRPLTSTEGDAGRRIRLLTLNPQSHGSTVSCSLHEVTLDAAPPFEALSYAWGMRDDPLEIRLEGKRWKVTQNLGAALRQLRLESEARVLWVDAICIDQSNLAERTQQVQIMHHIYRSARQVLIWLGEADPMTELAFQTMNEIFTALKIKLWTKCSDEIGVPLEDITISHVEDYVATMTHWTSNIFLYCFTSAGLSIGAEMRELKEYVTAATIANLTWAACSRKYGISQERLQIDDISKYFMERGDTVMAQREKILKLSEQVWHSSHHSRFEKFLLQDQAESRPDPAQFNLEQRVTALKSVFAVRSWWTRLWTVQEYVFAQHAMLLCGKYQISATRANLVDAALRKPVYGSIPPFQVGGGSLREIYRSLSNPSLMASYKVNFLRGSSLASWLSRLSNKGCEEPRDKIYAVLNLLSEQLRVDILPDYTKSISSVYFEATVKMITESRSINIICAKPLFEPSQHTTRKEIRNPSWVLDYSTELEWMTLARPDGIDTWYKAGSAELGVDLNSMTELLRTKQSLLLNGFQIDEINSSNNLRGFPNDSQVIECIKHLAPKSNDLYLPTGELALNAYCRTMFLDIYSAERMSELEPEVSETIEWQFRNTTGLQWESNSSTSNSDLNRLADRFGIDEKDILNYLMNKAFLGYNAFCTTKHGYMGVILGSESLVGDIVCVVHGCAVPLILRPTKPGDKLAEDEEMEYTLVGPAYIHGVMDGEVITAAARGEFQERTFILT